MSAIGDDLRRVVRGQVRVPGESGFDEARRAWNLAVEQRVSAVVEVADAADAAAVVRYAGRAGLAVSTRATGHTPTAAADGTVLVRTGSLSGIEIDAAARVARVQAGVRWGEVVAESAGHGLVGAMGSSPVVGVTGYTLGGGAGWFARGRGLAATLVRALDVVTADGNHVRVDADSEPDLFWALRGGGGDYALVTALEFELFEAGALFGGRMLWPAERAAAVLGAFREATAEAAEELSIWLTLIQFPPFPQVPALLRGQSMVAVDVLAQGEVTGPLRRFDEIPGVVLDTRRPLDPTGIGGICMEPVDPSPARVRGELLTEFSDAVAEALLAAAAPGGLVYPLALVQVRHLGGALTRPPANAGVAGGIPEPYLLSMLGPAPSPQHAAAVVERRAAIATELSRYSSGRKPFTYLDSGDTPADAFERGELDRLWEIKRRVDPRGVFRSNFPVAAPLTELDRAILDAPV
ncbi:FAD-dependent oxidoreductase [Nocardia niigatensis]|uniref:FAD-dependent oxidoreductase n=1 Tax=Nocardia niigatensis TaxID=209249 RepID=UPI0002F5CDDF|nr:FAD-binding protein [Nocardia niigatensis]